MSIPEHQDPRPHPHPRADAHRHPRRDAHQHPWIDVHQHLWPAPLIEALRARRTPPRLRGWTLELPGEADYEVDPRDHDVDARRELAAADGLGLAVISLSSPLGIETLRTTEARELIDAYHEGCEALPRPFAAWAAAEVTEPEPNRLAEALDRGFVGLQLPATALADAHGYEHLAPLLNALEQQGRPLLIHPGSDPAQPKPKQTPRWWPALVPYVQQMHAAWYAFRAHGRARHPRLTVCFAMLAGLAPVHAERFAARANERSPLDRDVFLEISSYGTQAIDAVVRVLGIDGLVNGSDRPYAAPVRPDLGDAALHALRFANPTRLLDLKEVSDEPALAAGAQSPPH